MSGGKLERVSVKLLFTTGTGYWNEVMFSNKDPVQCAVSAIDELAQLLAINGDGEKAIAAATDAVKRVKEWKYDPQPRED